MDIDIINNNSHALANENFYIFFFVNFIHRLTPISNNFVEIFQT